MSFRNLPALAICLLVPPLAAQTPESLDFLAGLPDFREIRNMLPAHLNRLGETLLEQRERKIAQLSTPQDVERRRAYVRERMLRSLGGLPSERTPLNARTVGVLDRDGYRIEKVIFESQPRFYVTANLYLPKQGQPPFPAVLFPLGHEAGAKAHSAWQQMLVSLAKKGYVGLAWDPIGQGERSQIFDVDLGESKVIRSTTEHTMVGIQCLLAGDNLARYTIWDGMRALDYLLSRKEVDPRRVACTGNSGGGTHTAYLSALDDRIQVAAPSCYLTSWRRLLASIGPQDAEQCVPPSLRDELDHADFVHAFAPRPYLILSAIRDFFSITGARETYQEAQRVYSLLGASEKLSMVEADDGHGYTQPRRLAAYRWFAKWLKDAADDDPEPQVTLETEQALYATETGQVSTALGGETVISLNQKRVEQNKSLRPKTELRRRVAELAGIEPRSGPVRVTPYGRITRPGYRIEKLVYDAEPGVIVPALLFVPEPARSPAPAILYAHGRGKAAAAARGGDLEQLVQAGFVALAIDARGAGETQTTPANQASDFPPFFGDYHSAMKALLVGRTLLGMRAGDISRGVDLLAARQEVDPERIYGFGQGRLSPSLLHAAVLDPRLRKLVLEEMLVSYESVVSARIHRGIFEIVIPGVLRSYDLPDLAAALASRPVWIVNATDPLGHRARPAEVSRLYSQPGIRIAERRPEQGLREVYPDLLAGR